MKTERQSSGKVAIALLIAATLLGAGFATLALSGDPTPEYVPTGAPDVVVEDEQPDPPPRVRDPAPTTTTDLAPPPPRVAGAESGVISGRVVVSPQLAAKIEVFRVRIEEAVNDEGGSTRKVRSYEQNFELEGKVGRFRLGNVPFSEFGWRVTAFTPEVESNSQDTVVQLTPEKPSQDVSFELEVPAPLHIALKNQDREPIRGLELTLEPIGRPTGRRALRGTSDSYGQWILERVRSGRYRLSVGPRLRPLVPPKEFVVKGGGLQYQLVTVPRGGTYEFEVVGPSGFPLADVEVSAIAQDLRVYKKYEAKTDKRGKAVLRHVPPGRYYVHFTKKGYTREFEKVQVVEKVTQPDEGKRRVRMQFQQ